MKRYRVHVRHTNEHVQSEHVVSVRGNTSMKSVILKGLEQHFHTYPENASTIVKKAKGYHRKAENEQAFLSSLEQNLQVKVTIFDLNNHTFYHREKDYYTTSYEEGLESFKRAWEEQRNEPEGEPSFEKYKPDTDTIIEHGNELTSEDYFLEDWELVE